MTKQELRKAYIGRRKNLDVGQVESLSNRIGERFVREIDLSAVRVLHTFLPIQKNNEPNTWSIIRQIQGSGLPIRFSVPRVSAGTGALTHYYLDSNTVLETNHWGIEEPGDGEITRVSEIDAVIIPLLIFDTRGQRVGYGKGFYDRFLSSCRPDTKRIGVSLFPPVDRIDDTNELDVPLHWCVTPDCTFTFKREVPAD
jgi:5-formyltetrahydrofolate cyclo-ligase